MNDTLSKAHSDVLDLRGRIALVTGGGQGVGRAIALKLAAHGAGAVIVNDFYQERADAVAAEIEAAGGAAMGLQGDVTDLDGMKALVAQVTEQFGSVDILVNNAGNYGAAPSEDLAQPFWQADRRTWDRHLGVNLYGVINAVSAAVPGMIELKRGRIITIMSEAGRVGEPGLEIYSGAKAGAAGFMRAIARSLARHGIIANTVSIAATETPATQAELDAMSPEIKKRWLDKYVIRRFGQPDDVANMVVFLAAEANSWITGQTYPVNGGYSFAL